jgi:geranylgeranyl diphosphate synthase type II
MLDIKTYLESGREAVNRALDRLLPSEDAAPQAIHRAMRYSVFAGGKRLRPILVLVAGEALGQARDVLLPAACAVEMIHTYSLIHDDLPAMDNDDLRRGRPTCHRAFGEAIAILAGDALLTLAFQVLASFPDGAEMETRKLKVIRELSTAAGTLRGMIGGQVVDIESQGKAVDADTLDYIHNAKTAALVRASVTSGAILAGASDEQGAALSEYGRKIGLAFQIIDDVLDVEESSERLGKTAGKDAQQRKATYPTLWGLATSKEKAARLIDQAIEEVRPLGPGAGILIEIARFVGHRRS